MRNLLQLLITGVGLAGSLALANPPDPLSQYRVLDWPDLVPENWEPPLIPIAHDKVEKAGVDPESTVEGLDNTLITLPGFMKPIVFEGNSVSEFLLVPYLPHHIKQHAHLHANQRVYVSLLEPMEIENPMQPLWVIGTMSLEAVFTEDGMAAYSVADGVATEYEYPR